MKSFSSPFCAGLSALLLATITRPAANAQWLYQDDFTTNPGALNGRATASGFGSWVNSDNALQTGGGLMTVSTNLPVDYHSATFALPTLSSSDVLTISITVRPAGSGFLGIGFTDYAGQYVINNGLSWLYINGVGTGAPGNVEIFRGMGSEDRVYNGTPAGFDASIPTTYSFTYNPINKTMGLSATNGSSSVVFFSALDISGLPSSAFNNFALQFQGQNISTESLSSYVSNIRAQVLPASSGNYAGWLANYPALGSNTNGTDDPDGDGFNNNLEYACGGNPTVGSPALMTTRLVGTNAVFNWVERTNGVVYEVQNSSALTNVWSAATGLTISNSADQSGVLLAPTYVRKEFVAGASSKEFYRVRATLIAE